LVRAAARLAAIKGFDRTSVQDVMAEAGVGKGAFYHHFPTKDALGLAVLEQDRLEFMAMLDACFAAKRGVAALECFFRSAFEKHRATGFAGGCLWGNTALEMSDTNPAFVAPVDAVFKAWIGKVSQAIEDGQADGRIRKDAQASELALLVVSAIEGGIMLSRLRKDETPMRSGLDQLRLMLGMIAGSLPLPA
jgi:TetR/AcrR family transcriptional repressor of nem operon